MKVVAIVAARMASTRLRGKHLLDLGGRPMLAHVLERAQAITGVDEVILATTQREEDLDLVFLADKCGVRSFLGSTEDVLARYLCCAAAYEADVVVRLTADCPLLDPALAALALDVHLRLLNTIALTTIGADQWRDGLDVEVFDVALLEGAEQETVGRPYHREHVTSWMYRDPDSVHSIWPLRTEYERLESVPEGWRKWSVDTAEDLARVRSIVAHLPAAPNLMMSTVEAMGWQATVGACVRAEREIAGVTYVTEELLKKGPR